MRRISFIAFSLAAALFAVSCEKEITLPQEDISQVFPEGATLTLDFGVAQDASTRADMASDPTIESIHVFVFDQNGTLVQVCKAQIGQVTQNYTGTVSAATVSHWKVTGVMMSAESRTLHFVANLDDSQVPQAGSEKSIFQTLATSAPAASYWQRVTVPSILPYQYDGSGKYSYVNSNGVTVIDANVEMKTGTSLGADGSYTDVKGYTVNKDDYIDATSAKIVNGTGYYASKATSDRLSLIHLVRNFARINFTNSWSKFTLRKIALGKTPLAGLVAPYSGTGFVNAYLNVASTPLDIDNVTGYTPVVPSGIDKNCPTVFTNVTGTTNAATLFMYERPVPTTDVTCVLIGGILQGATASQKDTDGNTWFKVELAKENGAYFSIYRDFTYNMTITGIDETAVKHASAKEAFDAAPVGDISNSEETSTLTQISDGKGLTLWVEYIDKIDQTGGHTVNLLYTFFYDNGSTKTYFCDGDNDRVTFTRVEDSSSTLSPAAEETVTKKGVVSSSSNSAFVSKIPHGAESYTWYLAEVSLKAPTTSTTPILKSQIEVKGSTLVSDATGYAKDLSRKVTYTVMGTQKLGLATDALSADASGNDVVLKIKLPDTFGPSAFPMTLKIEAEDNNLTPTDNLPVESGEPAFDSPKNSFYFLKTISYSDYQELASATVPYQFACNFKTTKATNKTPVTRIRVTQKLEGDDQSWFKEIEEGVDYCTVDLKVGTASNNSTN